MLQADIELARRIERAECQLVLDMAQAVARRSPETVLTTRLGSGAAIFAGVGSPLNKCVGLGFDGPLDEERAGEIEREFARRDVALRVELAEFAQPSIAAALVRRGYRLIGHENVLALRLDDEFRSRAEGERRAAPSDIAVTNVDRSAARAWLDVVITGFLVPDGSAATPPTESFEREALENAFADTIDVRGFDMYLAHRAGVAAGGGGVRRFEGIAQLCGASTLPEHRRRGVQTTLLRARLLAAARAGCDLAVVTTEPASKSQANAEARGFEFLYSRAVYVLEHANTRPH